MLWYVMFCHVSVARYSLHRWILCSVSYVHQMWLYSSVCLKCGTVLSFLVEAYWKVFDLAFRTANRISWIGTDYIGICIFLCESMMFQELGNRSWVYVLLLTYLDGHPNCYKASKSELGVLHTLIAARLPVLGDGVILWLLVVTIVLMVGA